MSESTISESYRVAVVVGSLRKQSHSSKVAQALIALSPKSLRLEVAPIHDLPLYNEDLESDAPAAWSRFRDTLRASDGVILITPEYNRSVPAVLKNAIDVASRPYGKSALTGAVGVLSHSPGALGGVSAAMHLRQVLPGISGPMLQKPEVFLNSIAAAFDDKGQLSSDVVGKILTGYLDAFAALVAKHARVLA